MTANVLLEHNPRPTRDEIREALSGNLCRCTGYESIIAKRRNRRSQFDHMRPPGAARFVGSSVTRVEDDRLLAGKGRYIADLDRPGLLHAAFLRSSEPHARDHTHRRRGRSTAERRHCSHHRRGDEADHQPLSQPRHD